MSPKTVLVSGANGFIGSAVCRAFSLAGWRTFGLIRSDRHAADLLREEVAPLIGSAADISTFIDKLPPIVDVIVSCSEDINNYEPHFNDVLALIKQLSQRSLDASAGKSKPLVIFSSGCKDYGTTLKHGEEGLAPHTEESLLNSPCPLRKRTAAALTLFEYTELFDCVVTRPSTLYGRSGSYYSTFFLLAQQAKAQSAGVLTIEAFPNSILHGTHVDDVASAYLALAIAPREVVSGQVYNIASHRYETLEELIPIVEKSHDIKIKLVDPKPFVDTSIDSGYFFNFPQWVDSEKLRKDIGWVDRKPLFHEGYETYRKAYEVATEKSGSYERIMKRAIFANVSGRTQLIDRESLDNGIIEDLRNVDFQGNRVVRIV